MRYLGSGLRYRLKRKAAAVFAQFSDLEARRAIRTLIQHWERHGFGEWAAEERASGRLVGKIGLHHHADWTAEDVKVEVGWLLARDSWGKGYATEGAVATLEDAFERVRLDRLLSIAHLANRRSIRVMERIGLSPVGQTRWRRSDVCWYAIDREEWERRRGEES
ncbi:MAG: hypothetical protein QOK32_848 [Gaiellaceae bacterium]|nr:hypothetical protein [Gaiellaceae bacterium]